MQWTMCWLMQGLVIMVTDVADEAQGVFHIWGNTPEGASVLVRVHDFQPYFYIAGPIQAVSSLCHYHCVCHSLCKPIQDSTHNPLGKLRDIDF